MLHRSSKTYMGLSGDLEERNNMLMIYILPIQKKEKIFRHTHIMGKYLRRLLGELNMRVGSRHSEQEWYGGY
jgi:hypothetical protein